MYLQFCADVCKGCLCQDHTRHHSCSSRAAKQANTQRIPLGGSEPRSCAAAARRPPAIKHISILDSVIPLLTSAVLASHQAALFCVGSTLSSGLRVCHASGGCKLSAVKGPNQCMTTSTCGTVFLARFPRLVDITWYKLQSRVQHPRQGVHCTAWHASMHFPGPEQGPVWPSQGPSTWSSALSTGRAWNRWPVRAQSPSMDSRYKIAVLNPWCGRPDPGLAEAACDSPQPVYCNLLSD